MRGEDELHVDAVAVGAVQTEMKGSQNQHSATKASRREMEANYSLDCDSVRSES